MKYFNLLFIFCSIIFCSSCDGDASNSEPENGLYTYDSFEDSELYFYVVNNQGDFESISINPARAAEFKSEYKDLILNNSGISIGEFEILGDQKLRLKLDFVEDGQVTQSADNTVDYAINDGRIDVPFTHDLGKHFIQFEDDVFYTCYQVTGIGVGSNNTFNPAYTSEVKGCDFYTKDDLLDHFNSLEPSLQTADTLFFAMPRKVYRKN